MEDGIVKYGVFLMGHRKHSAPRRGSLAFAPRARHQTLIPRVRNWTRRGVEKPTLAGFPAFKVGMVHVVTLDDREKTPNYGKPMFNPATVLSAPAVNVYGFRAYGHNNGIDFALTDVAADNLTDEVREKISYSKSSKEAKPAFESALKRVQEIIGQIKSFTALVGIVPDETGLANGIPQIQEVGISGGDVKAQFEYLK
ncbi:MAG: 50S ribosomal protein L3, partial [Nitrososphaerales archaeon]